MLEGMLFINFDPPYIAFSPEDRGQKAQCVRYCSKEDIHSLLLDLGLLQPTQHWAPRECQALFFASLSNSTLLKYGLGLPSAIMRTAILELSRNLRPCVVG